jgi:hypothetical protein
MMWKEAVLAKFKILSQNLPGGTEKNLSQDSRYPSRDLNPESPEYEAGALKLNHDVRYHSTNDNTNKRVTINYVTLAG